MKYEQIIKKLKSMANPKNVDGMARFGITPKSKILGISIWELRKLKKDIGTDHALAQKLWSSGIHEARILASFIDDPKKVTEKQLNLWVSDFDSWDIVDQVSELIAHTPYVLKKIREWSTREEEFIKRTAFSLIAELAWWEKKMTDKDFEKFFPIIKKASTDERNFVKKAVNWALRNIGKRNKTLNKRAIKIAREIQSASRRTNSKSARWIAADAIRELTSEKVQKKTGEL
jgi:3-methyladenine DNA glycosylase AlkD